MWPTTSLSKLLNIRLPIIQAPMAGGITTPALVSAVSNAGGLGELGAAYSSPAQIQKDIQAIKQQTSQPFAVNLFTPQAHQATLDQIQAMVTILEGIFENTHIPSDKIKEPYIPLFEQQFKIILEENVPILSFALGTLEEKYIQLCKANNIILIGTATSLQEAKMLERQGIDVIVAQGSEAGGHRSTFQDNLDAPILGLTQLLQELAGQVEIPVVAAGGIMDGKGIVAALKQHVAGVQLGTAFICCDESAAPVSYKKALLESKQDQTVLTQTFSGRIARAINNQFIEKMQPYEEEVLPFPIQNAITAFIRNEAKEQGNDQLMSLYAGQGHYLCKTLPAAKLIEELNQEVIRILTT
jgi:nitronate monooxygenase